MCWRKSLLFLMVGLIGLSKVQADQSSLDKAIDLQQQVASKAIKSQQKIDSLSDESLALKQEIQQRQRELENLNAYNAYLSNSVKNQQAQITDKEQQLASITVLQRDMIPLMLKMLDGISRFIDQDLPFKREQRRDSVSQVRQDLYRQDKTIAEKYRRLLEIYQQEAEYGRSMETYTGEIPLAGKPLTVELLRVGRIGLFYRSLDLSNYGYWNKLKGDWEGLPSSDNFELAKAYKVAAKRSAPELLELPLIKTMGGGS